MLITPPAFKPVMTQWLVLGPPCVVSLSANKWCELWVQVQMFDGHMVLERGWEYFCRRHKIVPGGLGLKVRIFNTNASNICRVRCSKNSCIDDIAHAM